METTLLEGLCEANNCQGGTIHQYFPSHANWHPMQDAYLQLLEAGVVFTRPMFDKLAGRFGLSIRWG